ncbi:MAG: type II toxin-antitoxin system VapC family toxin [Rhodospirillales bacterium]|nr:type II toxin-antitoxin system VapC family toxin [Rhodospirillales bacterium]
MTFLLDTNVVSEPRRRKPDVNVVTWLRGQQSDQLFLSALTLGEIAHGAEIRAKRDAVASRSLATWLTSIRTGYADRVLPITADIAETWGRLGARRPLPVVDGLLAATALVHRLTLVTRNVRDFQGLEIPLLDPWRT